MDGLVIGLSLNDDYIQICCYDEEKSWTIPTVICRRKEEETWLSGEDAYAATLLEEGVIVDKLLRLAAKDGTSTIGDIYYSESTLLRLFIQKVLEYPKKEFDKDKVAQLVITLQNVDARLLDTPMYCADFLGIPKERVHVISHTESFVYYVLNQKKEFWASQVGLFELSSEHLCYYEVKVIRGMRRSTIQAEVRNQEKASNLGILDSPSGGKPTNEMLCSCGERFLGRKLFSTVPLTGKGFKRQD